MASTDINFKTLRNEKHLVFRLLRGNADLIAHYKHYSTELRKYDGGIILPEQFLGCLDQNIFMVNHYKQNDELASVSISKFLNLGLYAQGQEKLETLDAVIAHEQNLASSEVPFFVKTNRQSLEFLQPPEASFQTRYGSQNKGNRYWFSNKRDALAYARSKIVMA